MFCLIINRPKFVVFQIVALLWWGWDLDNCFNLWIQLAVFPSDFWCCSCHIWQQYSSGWDHMAASIIGQFKMWFHLQLRAFYEICHCYHRQCGEERSLHLLRSYLAGCVRCLSEVCPHLQCLDGCSLAETLHLQRESIGLWQCLHRQCGQGHFCEQRLAECAQLPQVCPGLLLC